MTRFHGLMLALALAGAPASAATFTVTSTNDTGPGSLRQAIADANGSAGADTIDFNVSGAGCDGAGVCTITPVLPFPGIGDPVTIDGYTQPGASPNTNAEGALNSVLKIVISGANLSGSNGFVITSDDVTLRGLVVNGSWNIAINSSSADNVSVRGCFVGVDAAGAAAVPNFTGFYGFLGEGLAVGGPAPADRNLFSGNSDFGVRLERCSNCLVQGNLIGTDASGAAAIGAGSIGLRVGVDCPGTALRENVVAAAGTDGIQVGEIGSDTVFGITIQGNWVGTDSTGVVELGNLRNGIWILTNEVTVGGLGLGEGNVIAFNRGAGVIVVNSFPQPRQCPIRGNSIYSNGIGDGVGPCRRWGSISGTRAAPARAESRRMTSATATPGPTTTRTSRSSRRPRPPEATPRSWERSTAPPAPSSRSTSTRMPHACGARRDSARGRPTSERTP